MAHKNTGKATTGKLTHEAFVSQAIKNLRTDKSRGIHVIYSGFNSAFELYFGEKPRAIVDKLVQQGKFVTRPCKGGVMLFAADDAPKAYENGKSKAALASILGK